MTAKAAWKMGLITDEEWKQCKAEWKAARKTENKKCPKCDSDLVGIFFMGDKSRPPEFLACQKCHVAYDPDTLKIVANVVF